MIIIAGLALLYPLQRHIDQTAPREVVSEERLYFTSGETIKKMSLGLHGLVADIYWIRTIQYFGRKLMASGLPLSMSTTSRLRMDLLEPMLNIVVTLDPNHIPAYRFGAIFLPERNPAAAISLLERGVRENPDEWRLYQDLGYIHWQAGNYERAAQWYERGSQIEGARWWMRDMAGLMRIRGGSREAARAVYESYLASDDKNIRAQAEARLKQLTALDEMDVINAALAEYKQQRGSCPKSLRELAARLHASGLALNEELLPVDPDGFAYVLDAITCQAKLAHQSTIPR